MVGLISLLLGDRRRTGWDVRPISRQFDLDFIMLAASAQFARASHPSRRGTACVPVAGTGDRELEKFICIQQRACSTIRVSVKKGGWRGALECPVSGRAFGRVALPNIALPLWAGWFFDN
jgi:hypothetical protein